MPVRVIRVLEYEYTDHETAEHDMAMWMVPPNGTCEGLPFPSKRTWAGIRSATTFPHMVNEHIPAEPTWRHSKKPPQEVLDVLQQRFEGNKRLDEADRKKLAVINNWINLVTGQGGIEPQE